MFAWTPRGFEGFDLEPSYQRQSESLSFRILRVADLPQLWAQVAADVAECLDADAVRVFALEGDQTAVLASSVGQSPLPDAAKRMEDALLPRALARGRSLISNHPRVDGDLVGLSVALACSDSVVHALLLRAHQRTHGAVVAHWLGTPRPGFERRAGFYIYAENAALAMSVAHERAELQRTAFVDPLTGLPNQRALDAALARHAGTDPLGVLVLDFDGMRAANAAFENDYARGGDVLILAVARALERFARDGELAARMHTRGDEFCLLLPGSDAAATADRCDELQRLLTELDVPDSHRHVYRGASVGGAARERGEPPAETLARASRAMHERKRATRSR
jgi:diguanylate cyclase (GGDEF)-like protein